MPDNEIKAGNVLPFEEVPTQERGKCEFCGQKIDPHETDMSIYQEVIVYVEQDGDGRFCLPLGRWAHRKCVEAASMIHRYAPRPRRLSMTKVR